MHWGPHIGIYDRANGFTLLYQDSVVLLDVI